MSSNMSDPLADYWSLIWTTSIQLLVESRAPGILGLDGLKILQRTLDVRIVGSQSADIRMLCHTLIGQGESKAACRPIAADKRLPSALRCTLRLEVLQMPT